VPDSILTPPSPPHVPSSTGAAASQSPTVAGSASAEPSVGKSAHRHVPELDGIRGLAILAVLVLHFLGGVPPVGGLERAVFKLANFGTYGVALFFVLSGYLITGILIDSKGQPAYFRNFYARRTLRIFPLYYGVLLVGLTLWPERWSPPGLAVSREHQAWLWAYVANFFVAARASWDALPYFSHFWSLAVEEHFYFVWPFVVHRASARGLLQWGAAAALGALGLRAALALSGAHEIVAYTITPAKLDGLCIGGVTAAWMRRPDGPAQLRAWAPKVAVAALGAIVVGHVLTRYVAATVHMAYIEARETAIIVLFAAMLVRVVTAPRPSPLTKLFASAPMTTLGKYSYGLYVFHAIISWHMVQTKTIDVVATWVDSHTLALFLQAAAGALLSFAIAWLSFHLFERRFLVLKSRFEARTAT
jgi:peptidoglycan/LPS O-acetylase OafA/YrhL